MSYTHTHHTNEPTNWILSYYKIGSWKSKPKSIISEHLTFWTLRTWQNVWKICYLFLFWIFSVFIILISAESYIILYHFLYKYCKKCYNNIIYSYGEKLNYSQLQYYLGDLPRGKSIIDFFSVFSKRYHLFCSLKKITVNFNLNLILSQFWSEQISWLIKP